MVIFNMVLVFKDKGDNKMHLLFIPFFIFSLFVVGVTGGVHSDAKSHKDNKHGYWHNIID